eukprot:GHVU01036155.1.p1 GENE.GHVU01036155.1~~GHVU01036155.1.p1  ORF type:complete len:163 (+),score=4.18 GHVU01036155.1:804-1292(+)
MQLLRQGFPEADFFTVHGASMRDDTVLAFDFFGFTFCRTSAVVAGEFHPLRSRSLFRTAMPFDLLHSFNDSYALIEAASAAVYSIFTKKQNKTDRGRALAPSMCTLAPSMCTPMPDQGFPLVSTSDIGFGATESLQLALKLTREFQVRCALFELLSWGSSGR